MNNAGPLLVCCWLALAATFATAADSPPQVDDYHEIFAQFAALGAPDVAKATYVKVECSWRETGMLPWDYDTSGNAWLMAETRGEDGRPIKGDLLINGAEIVEIKWSEASLWRSRRDDVSLDWMAPPRNLIPVSRGHWRRADVEMDFKLAMRFLKSLARERFVGISFDHQVQGRLFLFAFALHQRGDTDKASLLLSEMVKYSQFRGQVVAAAVDLLANAQYEKLYRRFRTDYDWVAYRDGVKELLDHFPRSWRMAPAMRILLERIESRLAQAHPPLVAGLSAEDQKLAAQMVDLRAIRARLDRSDESFSKLFWLVPAAWGEAKSRMAPDDTELQIRSRGIDAIPLLLALLDDETLTEELDLSLRVGDSLTGFYHRRLIEELDSGFIDEEVKSAVVRKAYHMLRRPATRGEVAWRWLVDMVPTFGHNEELDAEKIRKFYVQHHRDSAEELAMLCLYNRYCSLDKSAVAFLMESARRGPVPALEEHLLAESSEQSQATGFRSSDELDREKVELLIEYVAVRGAEAGPLIKKMALYLQSQAANFKKPDNHSFESPDSEREYVAAKKAELLMMADELELIPYDRPIDDLIELASSSAEDRRSAYLVYYARKLILAKMRNMSFQEAIGLLLRQAVATDQWETRLKLVELAGQVAESHRVVKLSPTDHVNLWLVLIADDRPRAEEEMGSSVASSYLALNEMLFVPEERDDGDGGRYSRTENRAARAAKELLADHPRLGRDWLHRRVRMRLAGVPEAQLPPYPHQASLDGGGLARLKGKLASVISVDEARRMIGELDIYERVALPDLLGNAPDLNARLNPWANFITKVTVDVDDAGLRAQFTAWQGKCFSRELPGLLQEFAAAQAKAGLPAFCMLSRRRDFGGCEIFVGSGWPDQKEEETPEPDSADVREPSRNIVGWSGLVCAHGLYAAAYWRTAPPPSEESWQDLRTSEPDAIAKVQQAIDTLCGGGTVASETAFVVFQTKGDRP